MRYPIRSVVAVALLCGSVAFADQATRALLAKRQPAIDLKDIALSDAIDFLRDSSGINLVVDWPSLEQVGVGKETPVTLKLRNVPLRGVLKAVLEAASPGLLTYYVDGNVLNITTLARADEKLVTLLYPVEDLLLDVADFAGPRLNLTDNNTRAGQNGGGGGNGLFDGNNNRDENRDQPRTKAERAQNLIDLIQLTIRPDIWDTAGGPARMRYFNGNLVVTAPRSVHEAIGGPVD